MSAQQTGVAPEQSVSCRQMTNAASPAHAARWTHRVVMGTVALLPRPSDAQQTPVRQSAGSSQATDTSPPQVAPAAMQVAVVPPPETSKQQLITSVLQIEVPHKVIPGVGGGSTGPTPRPPVPVRPPVAPLPPLPAAAPPPPPVSHSSSSVRPQPPAVAAEAAATPARRTSARRRWGTKTKR
jgi:hypothetical protein